MMGTVIKGSSVAIFIGASPPLLNQGSDWGWGGGGCVFVFSTNPEKSFQMHIVPQQHQFEDMKL